MNMHIIHHRGQMSLVGHLAENEYFNRLGHVTLCAQFLYNMMLNIAQAKRMVQTHDFFLISAN